MGDQEETRPPQRHRFTEEFGDYPPPQPRETWFKRNAVAMVAVLVTIGMIGGGALIAWGNLKTENSANQIAIVRLEVEIAKVNAKVDQHHNDSALHMDGAKWDLLMNQVRQNNTDVQELRTLIIKTHRSAQ